MEQKIADISLLHFCNFACEYCISNSQRRPNENLILNEDGTIKVSDLRYDTQRGFKSLATARRNKVPYDNEDYNKYISGKAHPRGYFLDFNKLFIFSRKHLPDWTLAITGGEPLLYPKVDDFLIELTKTHRVILLTNLSLIQSKIKILEIPEDRLFYRVGFHPEQRTIDTFIKCVDVLKQANKKFVINYILHPKHVANGSYKEYIDILKYNGYPYEVTRFEGLYDNVNYSCHLPMKDWEEELIGSFDGYLDKFETNSPGSKFISITGDGDVFECHHRELKIGQVYEGWFNPTAINRPSCFTKKNTCPSLRASFDIFKVF